MIDFLLNQRHICGFELLWNCEIEVVFGEIRNRNKRNRVEAVSHGGWSEKGELETSWKVPDLQLSLWCLLVLKKDQFDSLY